MTTPFISKSSSGFSRGAYQCRALAAMIHKASPIIAHIPSLLIMTPCSGGTYSQRQRKTDSFVGLQHRSSSEFVFDFPYSAYEIYADSKSGEPGSSQLQTQAACGWSLWRKACHTSSDSENPSHENNDPKLPSTAERFKSTFSRDDVKVHFVGAWCVVRFWATHDCTRGITGTLFHQSESSEERIFPAPFRQSIFASFVMLSHSMNAE